MSRLGPGRTGMVGGPGSSAMVRHQSEPHATERTAKIDAGSDSYRASKHGSRICVESQRGSQGRGGLTQGRRLPCSPLRSWEGGPRMTAMKITVVETAVLRIPTRKPIALDFPHHSLVITHVRTDEGVVGFGYTLAFGGGGVESIAIYLETRLAPVLIGADPLVVERVWERMYRADRGIKRQGIAAYAISALDIALWDIVGKAAGLPLYKLWGAVTDRVPAYGSGGWPNYSLADLIGEAQAYVARGCRYYKMKK